MKSVMEEIRIALKDRVSLDYFSSYCELIEVYEQAMNYLSANANNAYSIFYDWFREEGSVYFRDISRKILSESLDERFVAFMNIYGSYLADAIEDESESVILEFLYIVPKRMLEDFEKFGYLASIKEKYVWNMFSVFLVNNNCNYYMKPGSVCQASSI